MQRVWFNKTFSSVTSAIRLIREADIVCNYQIVCSSTNPHATAFLEAHETAVEPNGLLGNEYLNWCIVFCIENRINIFVPGKEATLISSARDLFAEHGVRVLSVASQEVLSLLQNKANFYQSVDLKLAPPAAFRVFENFEQFNIAYKELRKEHDRLCLKPSTSVYGLGFSVIDEVRSSAQLLIEGALYTIGLDDLQRGFAIMGEFQTMLLMEYLDCNEYSVDCVGDNGRLICAIPRRKSKLVGQGQIIELRNDIIESTKKLTSIYKLNGLFNIQFREGKNGLSILEINPRMSGGIAMACLSGPNLPYLALVGFDQGFDDLHIPEISSGIRVIDLPQAMELH